MGATLKRIDTIIPGGIDGWKGKPLPGLGGYEAKLPIGQLSAEGRRNRMAIQRLGNSYVKLVTGSGGSTHEMNRILGSMGLDQAVGEGGGVTTLFSGAKSDTDVMQGVRDIKAAFAAQQDVLRNGYGKENYESVYPTSASGASKGERKQAEKAAPAAPEDVALKEVTSNLKALYIKYAGEPEKQKRVLEEAKKKNIKLGVK
jgi:hypothetical protein